jgi:hypothetical protein
LSEVYARLGKITGFTSGILWTVGHPRTTMRGEPIPGEASFSRCFYRFPQDEVQDSSADGISTVVGRLVKILYSQKDLLDPISSDGGTIGVTVGWFIDKNSGEVFSAELLKEMSDLQISLGFDVYPPDQNSVEE